MRANHSTQQPLVQELVQARIDVKGFIAGGEQKKTLIKILQSYGFRAEYVSGESFIPVHCTENAVHLIEYINRHVVPRIAKLNTKSWFGKHSRRLQRNIVLDFEDDIKMYLMNYIGLQYQEYHSKIEHAYSVIHKVTNYFKAGKSARKSFYSL